MAEWTDKDLKALRAYVWSRTYKDYKSNIPGRGKYLQVYNDKTGGTELVAVDTLTADQLKRQIQYLLPKTDKDRELFKRLGLPVKESFGDLADEGRALLG